MVKIGMTVTGHELIRIAQKNLNVQSLLNASSLA